MQSKLDPNLFSLYNFLNVEAEFIFTIIYPRQNVP